MELSECKTGTKVEITDPWFYEGEGLVLDTQVTPHHAVYVEITKIHDPANQHWVGRNTWLFPGNLEPLNRG